MKVSAGKVLMIVENPYPQDSRVRNEAMRLVNAGYIVNMIAKNIPINRIEKMFAGLRCLEYHGLKCFLKLQNQIPNLFLFFIKSELNLDI